RLGDRRGDDSRARVHGADLVPKERIDERSAKPIRWIHCRLVHRAKDVLGAVARAEAEVGGLLASAFLERIETAGKGPQVEDWRSDGTRPVLAVGGAEEESLERSGVVMRCRGNHDRVTSDDSRR